MNLLLIVCVCVQSTVKIREKAVRTFSFQARFVSRKARFCCIDVWTSTCIIGIFRRKYRVNTGRSVRPSRYLSVIVLVLNLEMPTPISDNNTAQNSISPFSGSTLKRPPRFNIISCREPSHEWSRRPPATQPLALAATTNLSFSCSKNYMNQQFWSYTHVSRPFLIVCSESMLLTP